MNDTKRLLSRHARRIAGGGQAAERAWPRFLEHFDRYRELTGTSDPPIPAHLPTVAEQYRQPQVDQVSDQELEDAYSQLVGSDWLAARQIEAEFDRRDQAAREASAAMSGQRRDVGWARSLSDDELDAATAEAIAAPDGSDSLHLLESEMYRRDAERAALAEQAERGGVDRWAEAAMAGREDPITNPSLRRQRPLNVDAQCRQAFDEHAYCSYLAAEADCNGVLVNSRGQARGVSAASLFTGSRKEAEAYASDELKGWWNLNGGRLTFTAFRGQMLGRDSDRNAVLNSRVSSFDDVANVA